jgi:uncharacterized protein
MTHTPTFAVVSAGDPLTASLLELAREVPWLMAVLRRARDVMDAPWCIAAGAVRSLVWNHLHGFPLVSPQEIDLVYFDAKASSAKDITLVALLLQQNDQFEWDVVNQAFAHTMTGAGDAPPFVSLEHAMACWPETATAVGLCLDRQDRLRVVAPHGLGDLFALVLRPSPYLRHPDVFLRRVQDKAFCRRWPLLRVQHQ